MPKQIILASQSPFRKMLLQQLGFDFDCISPNIDERDIEKNWQGHLVELPEHLAFKKAEKIANQHPDRVVIGSDQMLLLASESFSKPESKQACIERLQFLQGKTHELHTGLCLIHQQKVEKTTVIARMTMRPLTTEQITKYVDLDQPLGCAGGYKIEEKGMNLFSEIETKDHSSIVGLPLLSLVSILRQWGISIL